MHILTEENLTIQLRQDKKLSTRTYQVHTLLCDVQHTLGGPHAKRGKNEEKEKKQEKTRHASRGVRPKRNKSTKAMNRLRKNKKLRGQSKET